MADVDLLPPRGITAAALVNGNGIAVTGTQTVAQLASRGMRAICEVTPLGIAANGTASTVAQLASMGIRAFCPVSELGVASDSSTADTLRMRGIRPLVPVSATGIALSGSATILTLAQRGLGYFCPLDEAGNATTLVDPTPLILRALTGTYQLTGKNATLTYQQALQYSMQAGVGSFVFTGEDMTPVTVSGYTLIADNTGVTNKFTLTGQSATLTKTAAAGYVGPGDLTPGAVGWWGLRAYSNAQLSGTTKAIQVVDSAWLNLQDINILPTGQLDLATLNTWIAAHGTAHVYIWYDQSGNGNNMVNGGGPASMPQIQISPAGLTAGRATLKFDGTVPRQISTSTTVPATTQPCTLSVICNRTAATPGLRSGVAAGPGSMPRFGFETGNTFFMYAGASLDPFGTTANNTWYAVQAVWNGASSHLNVASTASPTGVDTASSNVGTGVFAGGITVGATGGGDALTGYVTEIGGWNGSVAAGMGANQIASL